MISRKKKTYVFDFFSNPTAWGPQHAIDGTDSYYHTHNNDAGFTGSFLQVRFFLLMIRS